MLSSWFVKKYMTWIIPAETHKIIRLVLWWWGGGRYSFSPSIESSTVARGQPVIGECIHHLLDFHFLQNERKTWSVVLFQAWWNLTKLSSKDSSNDDMSIIKQIKEWYNYFKDNRASVETGTHTGRLLNKPKWQSYCSSVFFGHAVLSCLCLWTCGRNEDKHHFSTFDFEKEIFHTSCGESTIFMLKMITVKKKQL